MSCQYEILVGIDADAVSHTPPILKVIASLSRMAAAVMLVGLRQVRATPPAPPFVLEIVVKPGFRHGINVSAHGFGACDTALDALPAPARWRKPVGAMGISYFIGRSEQVLIFKVNVLNERPFGPLKKRGIIDPSFACGEPPQCVFLQAGIGVV